MHAASMQLLLKQSTHWLLLELHAVADYRRRPSKRERERGSACELVSILCLYSFLQFYSHPRIALAIAVDCYSLLVLFIFRLQIFRRP